MTYKNILFKLELKLYNFAMLIASRNIGFQRFTDSQIYHFCKLYDDGEHVNYNDPNFKDYVSFVRELNCLTKLNCVIDELIYPCKIHIDKNRLIFSLTMEFTKNYGFSYSYSYKYFSSMCQSICMSNNLMANMDNIVFEES